MSIIKPRAFCHFLPDFLFILSLVALLIGFSTPTMAFGADETVRSSNGGQARIRLTITEARSFQAALKAFSKARIAIVAEDAPLDDKLSDKTAQVLLDLINASNGSPEELIALIAEAHDYTATRSQSNLFILKKRFTSTDDLPCVTLEEWGAAVDDVVALMAPFSPKFPSLSKEPRVKDLLTSFTQEQISALSTSTGISIATLNPAQRQQVSDICGFFYIQAPLRQVREVQAQVQCVQHETTKFGWFDQFGLRLFGYEGVSPASGGSPILRFRPLSHAHLFWGRADGAIDRRRTSSGEDPTEPKLTRPLNKIADADIVQLPASLKSILENLKPAPDGFSYEVNPILANKRVTVAGIESVGSEKIFRAVSEVYGLRTVQRDEKKLSLERPARHTPRTVEGLHAAVREVLPDPFLRAYELDSADTSQRKQRGKQVVPSEPAIKLLEESREKKNPILTEGRPNNPSRKGWSEKTWHIAAARQLRTIMQPVLEAKKRDHLTLPELGASERFALANLLMSDAAEVIRRLIASTEAAPYIVHFDKLILTGGIEKDPRGFERFGLTLGTPRANGSIANWAGFSVRLIDIGYVKQ